MEIEEKKLDQIISTFNASKKGISTLESNNSGDSKLTEIEKEFIETHRPEMALIVYGTLAPNKPNHSVVEHIKGKWQKATIKGKLTNRGWGAESAFTGFVTPALKSKLKLKPLFFFRMSSLPTGSTSTTLKELITDEFLPNTNWIPEK